MAEMAAGQEQRGDPRADGWARLARVGSVLCGIAPLLVASGIVIIPLVVDYADHTAAAAAVDRTGRWFVGHVVAALGFGIAVAASSCVLALVIRRGYAATGGACAALIAAGAALHAAGLGADAVGPLAVRRSGLPATVFFDGSGWWVTGLFVAGAMTLGAGLILLVVLAMRAGLLRGPAARVALAAASLLPAVEAVPSGWGLYAAAILFAALFTTLGSALRRAA